MNREELSMLGFEIVAYAGDARSSLMTLLKEVRSGNFDNVEKHLKDADENLNLAHNSQTKILAQEEAALDTLGSNYSALIREQVKSTVVASKMIAESKYNYTITGMEQFYIKDGKFHMLLNEGEVVDKSYGVVDVTITK